MWDGQNEDAPLVTIMCSTYNHEPYIRQCLEGFVMQETDFKFEAVVHDDASTDKTADIIREYETKYPDIFKPIYQKTNGFGSERNSRMKQKATRGKYIALCEGDDYWTDPFKLQKQVDYLEENKGYGLVYSKVRYFYQSKNKFSIKTYGEACTDFKTLIIRNHIPTLTTVFRADLLRQYRDDIQPVSRAWLIPDYPLWLFMAINSKIHFINEISGVYRVLDNSASHSLDIKKREAFIRSEYSMKRIMLGYAKVNYSENKISDAMNSSLAANALVMGKRQLAKKYFKEVKKITFKNRIKYLMSYSYIFSTVYYLKYKH
jgi:glycosyltransferase involved in cell wall biosynthesis